MVNLFPFKNNSIYFKLIAIAIALGIFAFYKSDVWHNHKETEIAFTPQRWEQDYRNRYRMLDSLYEQYNGLEGMTRKEIRDLLGDRTFSYSPDMYLVREGQWFGQAGTFLHIIYDENEVFSGTYFTQSE